MEQKTQRAPFDRAAWLTKADPARRGDAARLLEIFSQTTGWVPQLWGPSIVGFGRYAYRYASGHGGESLVVGFAIRSADFALYGATSGPEARRLLPTLGPHRMGKSCLYIRHLAKVREDVLCGLIRAGVEDCATRWPVQPG